MRRRLALAAFTLALGGGLIAVPASAAPTVATTTTLNASPNPAAPGQTVTLTAVTVPPSGAFTLTVAPGTVNLASTGGDATGTLEDITVTDTRNTYPGWSVSGQDSAFTGSGSAAGSTISGNQLGWPR